MKHLFVPYELAVKLKEKGFNEPCFAFYSAHPMENRAFKFVDNAAVFITNDYGPDTITAPLYQQVIDWLRDEHMIFATVLCEGWLHTFAGKLEHEDGFWEGKDVNDYYVALTMAIEEALKLIP